MKNQSLMIRLLFILFFFSGMCGLVYEVVWTRMLALVMGNTVFAAGTVLASFMGGLALGSFLFGRIADGSTLLTMNRAPRPLVLYGLLECLLGAYCLAFPLLLDSGVPQAFRYEMDGVWRQFDHRPLLLPN